MTGTCDCTDRYCPAHTGRPVCKRKSVLLVHRIDMEDESGTAMCRKCAEDALDSGVFCTREEAHAAKT